MAGTSVAVVCSGAAFAAAAGPARADPIGDTRAQISATQAQIEAGAARVHSLTLAFQQANLEAATLGQQVRTDQAQIARLQRRVSGTEVMLRRQALLSYTGGTSSSVAVPVAGADPSVRAEYLQVATGDLNDTIDQFRTAQRQLANAAATLGHQQQLSRAAAGNADEARQQALAAAAGEQARLDQLQTQLNRYIEAAAVAAQRRAAAAHAAAARAAAAPTSQGLPVNDGLVAAVRAVVAAPAPSPSGGPGGGAGGVWLQLRQCESSDNYAENSGNGYYGAYQFSEATWTGLGLPGRPDLEPPGMQDQAAIRLQALYGWGQWPACSVALGLR
jgi:peptidoglycan hydrolase CwlO-like protein